MQTMITPAVANRAKKPAVPKPAPAPTSASATPVGPLTPSSLFNQYTQAYNEAKGANETRYNDINAAYSKRYSDAMNTLQGLGDQQKADLTQQYAGAQANATQKLTDAGLAGTTIAPTMQQGIERNQNADLARVNANLQQQKLGLQDSLSGDQLAFQERRQDSYPDLGQYAQLASSLGAAGLNPGSAIGGAPGATVNMGVTGPGGAPAPGSPAYGALYNPPASNPSNGGGGNYQAYLDSFYRKGQGMQGGSSTGGVTLTAPNAPMTAAEWQAKQQPANTTYSLGSFSGAGNYQSKNTPMGSYGRIGGPQMPMATGSQIPDGGGWPDQTPSRTALPPGTPGTLQQGPAVRARGR